MKKLMIFAFATAALTMGISIARADPDVVPWQSKNTDDVVTIENGTGLSLIVEINVAPGDVGINMTNCGNTSYVGPGSTAICSTSDPNNPISFTTDTENKIAVGTYFIRPQPTQ